jgi:hypothetical protein
MNEHLADLPDGEYVFNAGYCKAWDLMDATSDNSSEKLRRNTEYLHGNQCLVLTLGQVFRQKLQKEINDGSIYRFYLKGGMDTQLPYWCRENDIPYFRAAQSFVGQGGCRSSIVDFEKPVEGLKYYHNIKPAIISFASFGRRLEESAYRAACTLLDQTVEAKVILWANTPVSANSRLHHLAGLEIRQAPQDIRSYSKLIWSLQEFPDNIIITADDDMYYPRNWLEQLLEQHQVYSDRVIAHSARHVKFKDYEITPYLEWDKSTGNAPAIHPLGCGGILYPPACLHRDVLNSELFMNLCPTADDIWFWAMAVLNGTQFYLVPEGYNYKKWMHIAPNQRAGDTCLWDVNQSGGNDQQLAMMVRHYPDLQAWVKENYKAKPVN